MHHIDKFVTDDYYRKPPKSVTISWMVNFADLLTLLLTFFIMMYAARESDGSKWSALRGSVAETFGSSFKSEDDIPVYVYKSISTGVSSAEVIQLDYLFKVFKDRVLKETSLANYIDIQKAEGRIHILLNDTNMFIGKTDDLNKEALGVLDYVGENLEGIGNNLQIIASININSSRNEEKLFIARALNIAKQIKDSGYVYNIDVFGEYYLQRKAGVDDGSINSPNNIKIIIEQKEAFELTNFDKI